MKTLSPNQPAAVKSRRNIPAGRGHNDGEAILVLDCGTSGIKSALVVKADSLDSSAEIINPWKASCDISEGATGDGRFWDPLAVLRAFIRSIKRQARASAKAGVRIRAIALTTTTSSLVPLRGTRILHYPGALRWDDQQSHEEAEWISTLQEKSGAFPWLRVQPDSGISKALFLARTYPNILTDPEVVVVEEWTFLNWFLTKKLAQSESILAQKWGFTRTRNWPKAFKAGFGKAVGEAMGIVDAKEAVAWFREKMLPGKVYGAAELIGRLDERVARLLDLDREIEVYSVPFDSVAQIVGLGMTEYNRDVALSFGTSMRGCAFVKRRGKGKTGPIGPIPDLPFPRLSMVSDGIASCGSAIHYVCDEMFRFSREGKVDLEAIAEAIDATEPGSDGISMLPFYNGGRRAAACPGARGAIEGLYLGKDDKNVLRALFEGISFITKRIISDFELRPEVEIDEVRVAGGLANNGPFLQMLANVLRKPVKKREIVDATILGCASCAAAGLGWFATPSEAVARMSGKEEVFSQEPNFVEQYESIFKAYEKRFGDKLSLNSPEHL